MTVQVFGRDHFAIAADAERAQFLLPDGSVQSAIPYDHRGATFTYDDHGYETVALADEAVRRVSFSASMPGKHTLTTYAGERVLDTIEFMAEASDNRGFIEVSNADPRYFAHSDGPCYVPIGLNMVGCDYDRLPASMEHFTASQERATTGMLQWRRWFGALRDAGANYARLWLSSGYCEARTERMGVHDPVGLARFDAIIQLARESGIYLKLCFEHWRTFSDVGHFAYRRYVDPDTGAQLTDEDEWFNSPKWNALWLADILPYIARCQNDPIVFSWELWNEIDCGEASFESVTGFTQRMLREVKALSPRNLAVNSLGSFDEEWKQQRQDVFRDLPEMAFSQVHRYLDQGAPMQICHGDPVVFSIEAVDRSRREDKPVILTETGAVNDRHVGPFRFYPCDHDGLIFHDVTYPALFAGAAGSGHIWHWNNYVENKNLWRHFRPMADALCGIEMDKEGFVPGIVENEWAWILLLRGRRHALALVRNRADRWDYVMRDAKPPAPIEGLVVPVPAKGARAHWLMDERPGEATVVAGGVCLPTFLHGCVLVIDNAD